MVGFPVFPRVFAGLLRFDGAFSWFFSVANAFSPGCFEERGGQARVTIARTGRSFRIQLCFIRMYYLDEANIGLNTIMNLLISVLCVPFWISYRFHVVFNRNLFVDQASKGAQSSIFVVSNDAQTAQRPSATPRRRTRPTFTPFKVFAHHSVSTCRSVLRS